MAGDSQSSSDEELARQAQAGSLNAFEELVTRYENRLYAFACYCCGNSTDAQEVAQDTFVKAYRSLGQYDPSRAFAPWLFTIARRKSIDRRRAGRFIAEEPIPERPDWNDPAELLARQDERNALWELARQRLPELQFEVLWLKYAEEMTVEEIAQVVRKTRVHIKVLLFRARQTLKKELEPGSAQGTRAPAAVVAREFRLGVPGREGNL